MSEESKYENLVYGALVFLVIFVQLKSNNLVSPPSVSVVSVYLSNFSTANSIITGNWEVRFQFEHTQGPSFYRKDVAATLHYKSKKLSETILDPFDVDKRNSTTVVVAGIFFVLYVDRQTQESIEEEQRNTGRTVNFHLDLEFSAFNSDLHLLAIRSSLIGDAAVAVNADAQGSGYLVDDGFYGGGKEMAVRRGVGTVYHHR